MAPIIEVKDVSKEFPAHRGARALAGRGGLQDLFARRKTESFAALRNVAFDVEPGESVGVIGRNGSGKSTLLKLIAGVTVPTRGEIAVHGRIASLLELGAGFHPILTGRENIYLNAGMLGLRRRDVDKVYDSIVEFSGVGDFIDNPVETYSSGMYVRLGFAVAVHADPAIFLVDEVLAVGDEEFQRKCRGRIHELREEGKTILFVSHDLGMVSALCDRVLLLNKGELVSRPSARETIDFYLRQVGNAKGVHLLRDGAAEVIVGNGRLSVFHNEKEITHSAGAEFQAVQLGAYHNGEQADWRVTEASGTHCAAEGRMYRIPVTIHYDVTLEDSRLTWRIDVECRRDAEISLLEVNLFLRTAYERWLYGDLQGAFPIIAPRDTGFTPVVANEMGVDAVAAFGEAGGLPPLLVRLDDGAYHTKTMWANTDYMMSARALNIGARIPDAQLPLKAGRTHFLTLTLDLGQSEPDIVGAVRRERTVACGDLAARFYEGCIELSYRGQNLTTQLHFWAALLVNRLWHNSDTLRWGAIAKNADALTATGVSRRLPMQLHWTIWSDDIGIRVAIDIECFEPLTVQEYHASLMADGSYGAWRTAHEAGVFPDFTPGQEDWVHLNAEYEPAPNGTLLHDAWPALTVETFDAAHPLRFTALNTGFNQHARVLQALYVSPNASLKLNAGVHRIFDGRISLGDPAP